jgi:hypothetical protein
VLGCAPWSPVVPKAILRLEGEAALEQEFKARLLLP